MTRGTASLENKNRVLSEARRVLFTYAIVVNTSTFTTLLLRNWQQSSSPSCHPTNPNNVSRPRLLFQCSLISAESAHLQRSEHAPVSRLLAARCSMCT